MRLKVFVLTASVTALLMRFNNLLADWWANGSAFSPVAGSYRRGKGESPLLRISIFVARNRQVPIVQVAQVVVAFREEISVDEPIGDIVGI